MHVAPRRFSSWLLVGFVGVAAACTSGPSAGATGGAASGGGASAGGSGGAGGNGGFGGSTTATRNGGAPASGGVSSGGSVGTGGGAGGQASGGYAAGGSGGAGGGPSGGGSAASGGLSGGTSAAGGQGAGGAGATGGQGAGGRGTGGVGAGGTGTAAGGRATGGASGSGASGSGGSTGVGGSTAYRPCPSDGSACKIMPFGDSITDGYNGDTPGGYRVELFRLIHAAGKNVTFVGSGQNGPSTVDGAAFPRNHEGHSGWTIDPTPSRSGISTLLKNDGGSQSVMVKHTPHIVLLMIGTNDAIDSYDMGNAPKRLGNLIDTIYNQLANVLVVVAQPIPGRDDASKNDDPGLSARIKTYNDAIPAVVKARADAGKHILIVDMFTPFTPKASLLEDQWHPNLQGYVVLGTQWYKVLQPLL